MGYPAAARDARDGNHKIRVCRAGGKSPKCSRALSCACRRLVEVPHGLCGRCKNPYFAAPQKSDSKSSIVGIARQREGHGLKIPHRFHVLETDGWLVNHRMNSALPGYLMISAKADTDDLFDLPQGALEELGPLL